MDLVEKLESANPALHSCLDDIRKFCVARWKIPYLSWFTNHDVEHSEEIIHLLGQILKPIENQESFLTEHELFVLLASAYLHDIGMQSLKIDGTPINELTPQQYNEIRKRHAQESFDVILKRVMTVERDDFHLPESLDEDYVSSIAFVSKGHSTDFFDEVIEEFKKNPPTPKNRPIRAEMLTALLLIADELDLHNKRADFSKMAQIDVSSYTQLHLFKHHYVNYVSVENGTVKLTLMFPPKSEDYKELIREYIETKLIEQIEKVNPVLKKETANHLHLESKVDIQIKEDSTGCVKRPLPPEVLEELEKILGKKEQAMTEEMRSERTVSDRVNCVV